MIACSACFTGVGDLALDEQTSVVRLVYASLPQYYDLFALPQEQLFGAIRADFDVAGSEVSAGKALIIDSVAGVYFALPSKSLRKAQLIGLKGLLAKVPQDRRSEVAGGISAFGRNVARIPFDSYYLSRFAVRPDLGGRGFAKKVLEEFLASGPPNVPASLHVHRNNRRAMRLYEKSGFRHVRDEHGATYRVMIRESGDLDAPMAQTGLPR